jgi:hypothetical protein
VRGSKGTRTYDSECQGAVRGELLAKYPSLSRPTSTGLGNYSSVTCLGSVSVDQGRVRTVIPHFSLALEACAVFQPISTALSSVVVSSGV